MNSRKSYIFSLIAGVCLAIASLCLQLYHLLDLEELYIFLYDRGHFCSTIMHPGGAAQLMASFVTQTFYAPAWCIVCMALVYGIICMALCQSFSSQKSPLWLCALAAIPCLCLFLCLETNAYKLQGHMAFMIAALALWLYTKAISKLGAAWRIALTVPLLWVVYFLAGPVALPLSIGAAIYESLSQKRGWTYSILFPLAVAAMAYVAYKAYWVATFADAFTPLMYYEFDSTTYMTNYAWLSFVLYMLIGTLTLRFDKEIKQGWLAYGATIAFIAIAAACTARLYTMVHSKSNYRLTQERYYAKNGRWDDILNIDYGTEPTPYTSYRNLALAHRGKLAESLSNTRPYISYFFENTQLNKRQDLQVLSDIYYDCDHMGGARHYAFDTDMVTHGAFNPYELKKLVAINITTGDYAVAEKLISQLEKTWRFASWASDMRRYLYNDSLVEADPVLGNKRKAIPATNSIIRPKGFYRDLKSIVESNPDQIVADQFLKAFTTLVKIDEE